MKKEVLAANVVVSVVAISVNIVAYTFCQYAIDVGASKDVIFALGILEGALIGITITSTIMLWLKTNDKK